MLKMNFNKVVFIILIAIALFLFLAPSMDRQEEMHGFICSGKYVVGNGFLVGTSSNRIAFVTCDHVITEKMMTTGLAFNDVASKDNAICINIKGKGFVYTKIAEIDPKRWCFPKDKSLDIAWIVLKDEEIQKIASDSLPLYLQLPTNFYANSVDIIREANFPIDGIEINSEVSSLQLFSPVTGTGDATKLKYFNLYYNVPFFDLSLGVTTRRKTRLYSQRSTIRSRSNDPINSFDRFLSGYVLNLSGHVNCSGSPVFSKSKDGKSKLIGIITASNGSHTFFQTLDRVIPQIRETLQND